MGDIVEDYEKSLKLPLGHTGRKAALQAIDKEYHATREQERAFCKQYKGPATISFSLVEGIINRLCDAIFCRRPKSIKQSEKMHSYYIPWERTIYLVNYCGVNIIHLIHETAHSIVHDSAGLRGVHDQDFLWVEGLLFEAILNGVVEI